MKLSSAANYRWSFKIIFFYTGNLHIDAYKKLTFLKRIRADDKTRLCPVGTRDGKKISH